MSKIHDLDHMQSYLMGKKDALADLRASVRGVGSRALKAKLAIRIAMTEARLEEVTQELLAARAAAAR